MIAAVSNIAWGPEDDAAAYEMLKRHEVEALEIAPTRFWPDLAGVPAGEGERKADELAELGLGVCGFQALLYGRPDLQVFGRDGGRACRDYLKGACRLAGSMGAGSLVFGAPKNRLRGELSKDEAFQLAVDFFTEVGDAAAQHGVWLCLSPNPKEYGADFLLNLEEAAALAEAVNSPGVALNIDMGELALTGMDAGQAVWEYGLLAGHFHVSEPMLEPFDPARRAHQQAASALREMQYEGRVSLEMRAPAGGLAAVEKALEGMKRVYFRG